MLEYYSIYLQHSQNKTSQTSLHKGSTPRGWIVLFTMTKNQNIRTSNGGLLCNAFSLKCELFLEI
jgi:hypothetical protein